MRKNSVLLSLIVFASIMLAACAGAPAAGSVSAPTLTPVVEVTAAAPDGDAEMAKVVAAAVSTSVASTLEAQSQAGITPETPVTPILSLEEAVSTLMVSTPGGGKLIEVELGPQLLTATDIRAFGRVIGWVTGGASGEFVQGAQIALKSDFALKTLPEGEVFEFECVQYSVMNGEVQAKVVCAGALIRFSTTSVVSKGSIGTLWLTHAVVGSETEEWDEGFLNLPCICHDGDCRDE